MKRTTFFFSIIFLLFCLPLLCACSATDVYSSPEEFCQVQGYDNYKIVLGESSVFVVYEESPSTVDFSVMKHTDNGYKPIGCRIISKEFLGPFFATIYKADGLDDHYIILILSGEHLGIEIKDDLGSSFSFLPIFASVDEQTEIGSFASAYIGTMPNDYYKSDYWYKVVTEDDAP